MLGIFANNHHAALALDDLALFADRLHRRTDFHGNTSLGCESVLAAPRDAAASEIVRGELDRDLIPRINTDEVHAHLAGDMSHNTVPIGQFNLEHGIGQRLNYLAFHFDDIVLGQAVTPPS